MKELKFLLSVLYFTCFFSNIFCQDITNNPANPEDITTWRDKTVMYFSPHPDDELASSGTLALLTKNGNTVYIVVFCNGNAGTHDYSMSKKRLADIRKQEDIAANGIVGVPKENIIYLGYDDGMLEYVPQKEIVEEVCLLIRKYRPDAVFTLNPGYKYTIWHKTDHRAAALLTVDGARAAAYHLVFPKHYFKNGLKSHTVRDWFFYESDGDVLNPNYKVDITNVANLKWQAFCQHTSQFGIGNMKYTGTEMNPQEKENLKEVIAKDSDGKVYEHFYRLQESLSY